MSGLQLRGITKTFGSITAVSDIDLDLEIREMRTLVREVAVAQHVKRYAVRLVSATHPGSASATDAVNRFLKLGSSPHSPAQSGF